MWPNPQETGDLVTFTEEILNRKLHFLCSVQQDLKCLWKREQESSHFCIIALIPSQSVPPNITFKPAGHWHLNEPGVLIQFPPPHGRGILSVHSLISMEKQWRLIFSYILKRKLFCKPQSRNTAHKYRE